MFLSSISPHTPISIPTIEIKKHPEINALIGNKISNMKSNLNLTACTKGHLELSW